MSKASQKYCLQCSFPLSMKQIENQKRLACSNNNCDFILWNNPVPVVGGIIETESGILLARNKFWPLGIYSIITGFLEFQECPEEAILRETNEELGLTGTNPILVGAYPYTEKNQIVLVYHVKANGKIVLNDEIAEIKVLTKDELGKWPFGQEKLPGWPFGCGWAIRDWLNSESGVRQI